MNNCNPSFFQPSGPCLRISGGSKNNLYSFCHNNVHDILYLRIHQRNIHTERANCCCTTLLNMFTKSFRMHGSCTDQSQTSSITYSGSKPLTATPNHSCLNNRILNSKERSNSVHNYISFLCANCQCPNGKSSELIDYYIL